MNHYVYKLTDSRGNFYIGSRSSLDSPHADKYMGSGVWPMQCRAQGIELRKDIVESGFLHRRQACEVESAMIKANAGNQMMKNRTTAAPVPSGKAWRNALSVILDVPIFTKHPASLMLYVYLVGRDDGMGISERVLSLKNGYTMDQCNAVLSELEKHDLSPMPNIYKDGEIWKTINEEQYRA